MKKRLPTVETDRIRLRQVYSSDLALYDAMSDPEVSEYECWYPHKKIEDTMAFINSLMEKAEKGVATEWVIEYKDDGYPAGMINLHDISTQHRFAEMGFWLGRKYWGMGIAGEAAELVLKLAFDYYDLRRVHCLCATENTRCIRLLEKLGMEKEGVMKKYMYLNCSSTPCDVAIYALLQNSAANGTNLKQFSRV